MSADDNNAVWKVGYITEVLKAFHDGVKISATKRREYAAQGLAYADDVVAAIAAWRLEVAEARKHQCALPASIVEALNSGDGTYRP